MNDETILEPCDYESEFEMMLAEEIREENQVEN